MKIAILKWCIIICTMASTAAAMAAVHSAEPSQLEKSEHPSSLVFELRTHHGGMNLSE